MNKRYLLYLILLFTGCNSTDDSTEILNELMLTPEIHLPFKMRCDQFPGVLEKISFGLKNDSLHEYGTYYGKILKGDVTIMIKNTDVIVSPILYTIDKYGVTIDSLVMFDGECYIGTDTYYLPWITIDKDLSVVRTDTFYSKELINTRNSRAERDELKFENDTTIRIERFMIDEFGTISNKN